MTTLTDKAVGYNCSKLQTPEHNGFICVDRKTNLYEWWSLDGVLIKTLDRKPNIGDYVYRYKNGKIYRTLANVVTLNQFIETGY